MKLNDNEIEAIRYMEKEIYYFREAQESADKEIDDRSWYKKLYGKWQDDINKRETVLNIITKLQKENAEKDKQIDLMAEQIKIPESTMKIESFDIKPKTKFGMRYLSKEEVKQYFEKLAKEDKENE